MLALQSGPRFARDALRPLLIFCASWKLVGLAAGIAAATVFAAGAYVWERGRARSGLYASIGLGIALVQPLAAVFVADTYAFTLVDVVRRPEPPLVPSGPGR